MALQDYIREIGCCLLQLPGQVGDVAKNRLHQLTFEGIRLVGRRLRLVPDDGHRALTMGAIYKLKSEFYVHLLVSQVFCAVLTIVTWPLFDDIPCLGAQLHLIFYK